MPARLPHCCEGLLALVCGLHTMGHTQQGALSLPLPDTHCVSPWLCLKGSAMQMKAAHVRQSLLPPSLSPPPCLSSSKQPQISAFAPDFAELGRPVSSEAEQLVRWSGPPFAGSAVAIEDKQARVPQPQTHAKKSSFLISIPPQVASFKCLWLIGKSCHSLLD